MKKKCKSGGKKLRSLFSSSLHTDLSLVLDREHSDAVASMINGDSEPKESLLARFPGREAQISLLWDILGDVRREEGDRCMR